MSDSLRAENRSTPLQKLQFAVATLVSILGIYTSWQSTKAANSAFENSKTLDKIKVELQQRELETKRVQEFTKRIQEQLSNLAGDSPIKAKIALASLYSLAASEADKSILFTITVVSENEPMKNTIKDLILEDPVATDDFKEKIRIKLGKRLTTISTDLQSSESISQATSEQKLLQQLTQQQAKLTGWIYLGKLKIGSLTLESDKTIKSSQVPSASTLIETATSVNLRADAPNGRVRAAIKGILPEGLELKVKSIKKVQIGGAVYDAVWAQVTENPNN